MKKNLIYIGCAVFFVAKAFVEGIWAYSAGLRGEDVLQKILSGSLSSFFVIGGVLILYQIYKKKH